MKNKFIIFLVIAGMVSVCIMPYMVQGFWNPDEAVHINAGEIENSTLIIGTHLIHISGLTDELYEIARQSAADSQQHEIYYKSEMAKGTWFNITMASSIADISTAGVVADNETINGLFLEYHTKSDGITYDLRDGKAVNIFQIRNPYELESMDELRPLKLQFDMLNELEKPDEGDTWLKSKIEGYFATDIVSETAVAQINDTESILVLGSETKEADESINALDVYLSVLKDYGGGEEERGVVMSVMDSQDAKRRLVVCRIMYQKTYDMTVTMSGSRGNQEEGETNGGDGSTKALEDAKPEGYKVDSQTMDAVYETLDNLNNSIISHEGKVLGEGDTIHTLVRFRLSGQLIEDARALNMSACDEDVKKLLQLNRIMEGSVVNKEEELKLLEEELLGKGEQAYIRGLMAGENPSYQAAKANQSAGVMLRSIAAEYKGEVERLRNEYEFFIDAKCMRMANEEAQGYIKECLQKSGSYYGGIPSDGFYDDCKSSADSHVEWLNSKLNRLAAGGQETDADRLAMEKEELTLEYLKALDGNELSRANEIQAKLNEVSEQLDGIEEALSGEYSQIQTEIRKLESEIQNTPYEDEAKQNQLAGELADMQIKSAEIKSQMNDQSIGSLAAGQKADALLVLDRVRTQGEASAEDLAALDIALNSLRGIMDSNYKAAFPAVRDIYSAMVKIRDLDEIHNLDGMIGQVEEIILDNKAAYEDAMTEELSGEEAAKIAAGLLGEQEGWSDEDTAVFLAAAAWCMEDTKTEADFADLVAGMAFSGYLNQNPYVFIKAEGDGTGGSGTGDGSGVTGTDGTSGDGAEGGDGTGSGEEFESGSGTGSGTESGTGSGGETGFQAGRTGSGYVAVDTLGRLVKLRYIWNQTKSQAILADGSKYYEFLAFSNRVRVGKAEGDVVMMPNAALLKGVLYIPEAYVTQEFGWECIYLPGCEYALLVNGDIKERAEELSAALKEGGN